MAHGHRADPPQLRRATAAGRRWRPPLAPGRRAQPREVDDVGALGQLPARVDGGAGIGLVRPSRSARPGPGSSSESTASGWPCGDQTSVARSVTTSGSTIVSRCCEVLGRRRPAPPARGTSASSPGLDVLLRRSSWPTRRCSSGPPRRRRGSCATRGSGPRCSSRFWISPRHSRSATTTRFSTRAGTYASFSAWRSLSSSRSAASIAAGVVSCADQTCPLRHLG